MLNPEARLSNEIRELNLQYLILAQHLIRTDRAQAMFQLGISEGVADIIDALSPAQAQRVAASSTLMCRVRFEDEMVWKLISNGAQQTDLTPMIDNTRRLHASILMAAQSSDALHAEETVHA